MNSELSLAHRRQTNATTRRAATLQPVCQVDSLWDFFLFVFGQIVPKQDLPCLFLGRILRHLLQLTMRADLYEPFEMSVLTGKSGKHFYSWCPHLEKQAQTYVSMCHTTGTKLLPCHEPVPLIAWKGF